jgi:dihydrofolate reductase
MAKLIYMINMSLDGYVADKNGNFDWTVPDEEEFTFIKELLRPVGTYLYGRRMYEVMTVWQTVAVRDRPAPFAPLWARAAAGWSVFAEFGDIWRAADKMVYSQTLKAAATPQTRIEPCFEAEAVQRMKAAAASDLIVGGPTLAAHAFNAGLVDVCHLFIAPIMVGDGNRAFPSGIRSELALQDERRFRTGIVYLHYRSTTSQGASAPRASYAISPKPSPD